MKHCKQSPSNVPALFWNNLRISLPNDSETFRETLRDRKMNTYKLKGNVSAIETCKRPLQKLFLQEIICNYSKNLS